MTADRLFVLALVAFRQCLTWDGFAFVAALGDAGTVVIEAIVGVVNAVVVAGACRYLAGTFVDSSNCFDVDVVPADLKKKTILSKSCHSGVNI